MRHEVKILQWWPSGRNQNFCQARDKGNWFFGDVCRQVPRCSYVLSKKQSSSERWQFYEFLNVFVYSFLFFFSWMHNNLLLFSSSEAIKPRSSALLKVLWVFYILIGKKKKPRNKKEKILLLLGNYCDWYNV